MSAEDVSAGPVLAHVAEIWRFPVKSMQGERLERCRVDDGGVIGDRAFALRADSMRLIGTAKYFADLLRCQARYLDEPDGTVAVGVAVTLCEGEELDLSALAEAVATLPPADRPRYVRVVDEIPRTTWYRVRTEPLRAERVPTDGTAYVLDPKKGTYRRFTGGSRSTRSTARRGRAAGTG